MKISFVKIWFLFVLTFAIGFAFGRYEYQFAALFEILIRWLDPGGYTCGVPC